MPELNIRRSTTETQFAYLDANQDIRIEATRTDDGEDDWNFSIRSSMETVWMDRDAADKAQQFIRKVLQRTIPELPIGE